MRRLSILTFLSVASFACTSSEGGGGASSSSSGGASSGQSSSGSSGQDGSVDPPVDTTPERLVADKAADCVGNYVQTAPVSGDNTAFTVAGQARSFVLLLPPAEFKGPRPVFVGFHGTSENGQRFVTRAKLAEFAAKGFVVLAPSAVGNGVLWPVWDGMRPPGREADPNKDLELFDKMVRCTAAHYEVDKKRIYVGGHSAGGIFTNKVLRARSSFVAGGIVGSGVFSLTSDGSGAALPGGVFAIVTWGGDNDRYSGTTPNGVTVPEFSFVEQASLASQFYEADPQAGQVQCRGNELGHAWLPMNAWFMETLLAHPKGAARATTPLPAVPAGTPAVCGEGAYKVPPLPDITCGTSTFDGCQAACQLMADCGAENRTVGTVLKPQLASFGFTATSCDGCVARCQAVAPSAANVAALGCFKTAQATAKCGPGIEGSLPLMNAVDVCCKGRSDSTFCVSTCTQLNQNGAASAFFPVCKTIAP